MNLRFENDVKMYGIQTVSTLAVIIVEFENDVKMYGIQTVSALSQKDIVFENDVKMYGIKKIKEYIANQLQNDLEYDQMTLKEYIDPFTGEPVKHNK